MKKKTPIPKERRDEVINFFKNEYISVRNLDRRVSELARDLVWEHDIDAKDSIHVATALQYKLDRLHTFDEGLLGKTGKVGDPRLIIEKPSVKEPKLAFKVVKNEKEKTGTGE